MLIQWPVVSGTMVMATILLLLTFGCSRLLAFSIQVPTCPTECICLSPTQFNGHMLVTHSVKVHSVVIASNSSYFERVLMSQNGMNSVIVLKDMKFEVLRSLIEFMYCGETTVLEEDVDALLYASRKFEVKGLSSMTRQGVMFSAAEKSNDATERNRRFIFPAESAQPGMIQAVLDLTSKREKIKISEDKLNSLYFKKSVFQKRTRPLKKHGNINFPEAAMSDTEYAILKEAEESRKALEKLQKYVLNPNRFNPGAAQSQPPNCKLSDAHFLKNPKSLSKPESKCEKAVNSNLRYSMEDEIAAENLSHELNQHNQSELQDSTTLPTDVPIFVDDGNGNYVTLDVEMANLIAEQEIKYNLVQGVVMTSDEKGSQHSNPASILIPETQFQPESMPILSYNEDEFLKAGLGSQQGSEHAKKSRLLRENCEEISSSTESCTYSAKRKPFVVKEIIKLKQVNPPNCGKGFGSKEETNEMIPDEGALQNFDSAVLL